MAELVRILLAAAPAFYLLGSTPLQVYLLDYCFGSSVSWLAVATIMTAHALFAAAFAFGLMLPARPQADSLRGNSLDSIAWVLLAVSGAYLAIAVLRIFDRWDAFSQGSSAARFVLAHTRAGVTVLGFFNSFLLGAPAALALFVSIYGDRLTHRYLFRFATITIFGVFTYLVSLEGARLPYLLSLGFIFVALTFRILRGHPARALGPLYVAGLTAVSIVGAVFSYQEIGSRETASGRGTSAEVRSNYSHHVGGHELVQSPTAIARETGTASSASSIVGCFYYCHSVKSVDRITAKGADINLYGFYMMPNFFKLAELMGMTHSNWIAASDYYDINGMYSGTVGAALIDFSWFGILLMAIFGYVAGRLVNIAISRETNDSPLIMLASIVPVAILFMPVVDLISTAQVQSMIPWLLATVVGLTLAQRAVTSEAPQIAPASSGQSR